MESIAFRIEYDGPALGAHVMDVQVLAPSLLAFSDLCREANRVLNGDSAEPVQVNISATSEGCFGVVLEWVQTAYNQISLEQVAVALGILNTGIGLFSRLKQRRGIEDQRTQQRAEQIMIGEARKESDDRPSLRSVRDYSPSFPTWERLGDLDDELVRDLRIRLAHRQFLVPLELPGIEEIRFIRDGETIETFRKAEVEDGHYDIRPQEFDQPDFLMRPQVIEVMLQLRVPAFVRDRMWEFTYDGRRIYTTIRDADFLARVFEKKERFGAQDYFHVQMQITQELHPDGRIPNIYEILRVLEVNPIVPPMR